MGKVGVNTVWSNMASLTNAVRTLALRVSVGENVVIVAAVVLLLARFWRLDSSPPGFYADEMSFTANPVCLRHTGADIWGNGWGLAWGGVVDNFGTNVASPLHFNVLNVLWFTLAGDSIMAARALEVMISLVTVASTVGIAHNLLGRTASIWVLALSSISPWLWALSRVAFLAPETSVAHLFFGLWIASNHVRRADRPRNIELVAAGLSFGVGLLYPYTALMSLLVIVFMGVYLARSSRRWLSISLFLVATFSSYLYMQIAIGKYASDRVRSVGGVFSQLRNDQSVMEKAVTVVDATWGYLLQHLSLDFLVFRGDRNPRHHSGWGGMLSWPQILLLALVPLVVVALITNKSSLRREAQVLLFSAVGVLCGLMTAAISAQGIPHANRSLTSASFLVLACAAIAVVMSPRVKFLAVICCVVGGVFFASYLRDYFTEFPVRADVAFNGEIRREGERAQETGDFAGFYAQFPRFINMYGAITDKTLVYFEAVGTGRGCPGYR
jgi:4-amino-4-deoxy-L-arabinose transferase-like glycosyltransferase